MLIMRSCVSWNAQCIVVLVCTYTCMFWYNGPALVECIVVLVLQC